MPRVGKSNIPGSSKYRQVQLSNLRRGRRGKHHDLIEGILDELETVPGGSALEIPLDEVAIGLANVRSAVHRGAAARRLEIETLADEKNFYVYKKASKGLSRARSKS